MITGGLRLRYMSHLRNRAGTVAGAGVLILIIAACGGGQQAANSGGTVTVPTTPAAPSSSSSTTAEHPSGTASSPRVPPGGVAVPDSQVDSAALPAGYPRTVWTQEAGGVVGVYGEEGGCLTAHAQLTQESADAVRIELVNIDTSAGRMCAKYLTFTPFLVRPQAPLGERKVVLEYRLEKN